MLCSLTGTFKLLISPRGDVVHSSHKSDLFHARGDVVLLRYIADFRRPSARAALVLTSSWGVCFCYSCTVYALDVSSFKVQAFLSLCVQCPVWLCLWGARVWVDRGCCYF